MVEGRLAVFGFGFVLARDDGHVHDSAAAFFAKIGRLLHSVPGAAVVYGEVAGFDVEANLTGVGVVVNELLLAKQNPEDILLVRAGQYPQATVGFGAVVEVNPDIEHRHNTLPQEQVTGAVGMPTHLREFAGGRIDVVIDHETVFFVFADAAFVGSEQFDEGLQAGVLQKFVEDFAVVRRKRKTLDHFLAVLINTKLEGNPIDFLYILSKELTLNALDFANEEIDHVSWDKMLKMNDAVLVKKSFLFVGQSLT